jgi:hypothetical protein
MRGGVSPPASGDNYGTAQEGGLSADIAAEIRLLRKGRGVQASDLDVRLGPLMRELARRPDAGDAASRRQELSAQLNRCSLQLPEDLRAAALAGLALSVATRQMPFFRDRVAWLAERIDRDYRTALRRVNSAEQLLAEEIASELRRRRGRSPAADGWYLDEFRTVLRLGTETIESFEYRRIVSTQDDLKEVMAWLDIPRRPGQPQPEPGLSADMLYGGQLIRVDSPSSNRFSLRVGLPRPLQLGETHEYGLILRMPKGMLKFPHYILTPECQCNTFDLRVRFEPGRLPVWVRRVDGETVRTFDEAQPADGLIAPDETGEVHQEFHNLTMYLGYGIQWQPAG